MPDLVRAIELAVAAHRDQRDKAGSPYVLHPLKLMLEFEDEAARMVAVLHDTLEDSELSAEQLRAEGFAEEVVTGVEALTKSAGEDYMDFVRRAARHPIAKRVKLRDIEHNMDLRRLTRVEEKDLERVAKYHAARKVLLGSEGSGEA